MIENTNNAFKYNNKLGQNLTNNKPNVEKTKGIYKIPCKDCEKFYVGETGRGLKTRMSEHKNDIVHQKPESGVAEHTRKNDHFFDFKNAKFFHYSENIHRRQIIESAVLNKFSKLNLTVNLDKGFAPHNDFLTKHINGLINLDDFG